MRRRLPHEGHAGGTQEVRGGCGTASCDLGQNEFNSALLCAFWLFFYHPPSSSPCQKPPFSATGPKISSIVPASGRLVFQHLALCVRSLSVCICAHVVASTPSPCGGAASARSVNVYSHMKRPYTVIALRILIQMVSSYTKNFSSNPAHALAFAPSPPPPASSSGAWLIFGIEVRTMLYTILIVYVYTKLISQLVGFSTLLSLITPFTKTSYSGAFMTGISLEGEEREGHDMMEKDEYDFIVI